MALRLDVESLRTFVAVVERESMARAASALSMTPSAVSWKIKRLEQRVGQPLLIRDGHNIRATRAGRIVLEESAAIIEGHDRLVQRLLQPEFTGTIRIGSNEEVGAERIAALLGRFQLTYPEAKVEFVVNQSLLLTPLLDRGQVDVAVLQVTEDEVLPTDVVLWTDELRWATHRDLPYEEGPVPLISFGQNGFYRPLSEPILDEAKIAYRYAVTSPTSAGVQAAVEAGLGVAILGERFLTGDVVEWEIGAALAPLPAACQIVRTPKGEPSAVASHLIETIEAELGDRPIGPSSAL
jgi:DNA-binding transcriptional LysR family regulator